MSDQSTKLSISSMRLEGPVLFVLGEGLLCSWRKQEGDFVVEVEAGKPAVTNVTNHFNVGDPNAVVAAFNKQLQSKVDGDAWSKFCEAAAGVGLHTSRNVDTGEITTWSPRTYYKQGPVAAPTEPEHAIATLVPSRAEELYSRLVGPVPGPAEDLAGRRFKLVEILIG